jgi:hypothetical protein
MLQCLAAPSHMGIAQSVYTGIPRKPSVSLGASTDPVDTSAQALATHETTEQKESADTTFMAM